MFWILYPPINKEKIDRKSFSLELLHCIFSFVSRHIFIVVSCPFYIHCRLLGNVLAGKLNISKQSAKRTAASSAVNHRRGTRPCLDDLGCLMGRRPPDSSVSLYFQATCCTLKSKSDMNRRYFVLLYLLVPLNNQQVSRNTVLRNKTFKQIKINTGTQFQQIIPGPGSNYYRQKRNSSTFV